MHSENVDVSLDLSTTYLVVRMQNAGTAANTSLLTKFHYYKFTIL